MAPPLSKRKLTISDDDDSSGFVPFSAYRQLHEHVGVLTNIISDLRNALLSSSAKSVIDKVSSLVPAIPTIPVLSEPLFPSPLPSSTVPGTASLITTIPIPSNTQAANLSPSLPNPFEIALKAATILDKSKRAVLERFPDDPNDSNQDLSQLNILTKLAESHGLPKPSRIHRHPCKSKFRPLKIQFISSDDRDAFIRGYNSIKNLDPSIKSIDPKPRIPCPPLQLSSLPNTSSTLLPSSSSHTSFASCLANEPDVRISFLLSNIRGIASISKIILLIDLFASSNLQLLALTETFLDETVPSTLFNLHGLSILRFDRSPSIHRKKSGGGVAIIFKKSLSLSLIDINMKLHYPLHQSEIIACLISPSDSPLLSSFSPFTFCLVYRPPDTSRSQNAALIAHLDQFLPLNCCLLAGDFNYPSLKWDSPHTSHEFLSFINSKGLFQHVKFPTRSSSSSANILDLVITSKDLPVAKLSQHPPLLNSDHFSVEFDLLPYPIKLPSNNNIVTQSSKPRLNYNKCNLKNLNANLASYDWDLAFSTHSSPSSKYTIFIELLSQLIFRNTPIAQTQKPFRPSNLINRLRRTRHRYAILLKSASSPASQIHKLKSLLSTIKKKLKSRNIRSETLILSAPHSRAARSLIKKRVRVRSSVPPLSINNRLVSSNSEKATIFAQTFAKNFSPNNYLPHLSSLPLLHPVSPPISEIFPPWLIEKTSKNLPPRCGYTSHLANYFILKNCATSLALPLSIIFSDSLLTSEVPDSWKHATVIPIPKKGSLSSPENFRPISLTDPFAHLPSPLREPTNCCLFTINSMLWDQIQELERKIHELGVVYRDGRATI
ncbi:hypothetical protein CRE_28894 [Caenorhabditis remanei]|uniref:Endonuclease/exonuclease/phosphatase domain-containing protein n=1 Tax=Caenorhabditis remanei TaxID=31234 RepID=E3MXD9_CAERE|nr:hypothetical protein CRE_28894 [Caenorhabditis remanei]